MIKQLRNIALAVAATGLIGGALAQNYTHNPFYDDPAPHAHNYALRAMEIRFDVLTNITVDDEEVYEEAAEGLTESLVAIQGSLSAADPEVYGRLSELFDEIEEAVEEGEDYTDLVTEARVLVEQAESLLLPADFNEDPVNLGVVLYRLMLDDGGVAEGWEEIFDDELADFVIGYVALERSYELWEKLEPFATETQAFEVRDSLDYMATELYASHLPPENFHLMDAEAGEAPAHRIASYLESITDATLYAQRDLAPLVVHIDELAIQACELYGAGDTLMGGEVLAQSYYFYDENLPRMLNLFDPDLQEAIQDDYAAVMDQDGSADICTSLLENLTAARGLLGG